MIIRIQSPSHGTRRVELSASDTVSKLLTEVQRIFELSANGWYLYQNRNKTGELNATTRKSLKAINLRHGDMLYLDLTSDSVIETMNTSELMSAVNETQAAHTVSVVEDEVDRILSKMDGRIPRPRNQQLCHHGANGKCIHCSPLEPYDEDYMKSHEPPIKHMSFHSHIRKLTGGVDRGKFVSLENLSVRIKPGCTEHPPWPNGICTKCQPSAVVLSRQHYRHVDYVMFENPYIVERFLHFWRSSGSQRLGYLYGKYDIHKDVPLGIKAVVCAIYEPAQESSANSIKLLPDPKAQVVDEIAKKLGLQKVGWIFTDLEADDRRLGTVKHIRHAENHFLTAEECIMAGDFQNQHPNPCCLSPDRYFGSKFVTVIITGDFQNQIHFEAYQVSNQCMALVGDNCLVPTKDAAELGYIKESTPEQYVPDVFYKEKDEYGNEVMGLCRPLPVEYLILDVPSGLPMEAQYTFSQQQQKKKAFPVGNRDNTGETQNFVVLTEYMSQFTDTDILTATADLHVLVYLATMDTLPLRECMAPLLAAIKDDKCEQAIQWAQCEEWATVVQLMQHQAGSSSPTPDGSVGATGVDVPGVLYDETHSTQWTCTHCTFINTSPGGTCEMCGLPKNGDGI